MPSTEPARGEPRRARDRALANVLRMGHCAPAVARTLLDLEGVREDWIVKLVAGLPGGIGNTGGECGGITAPLVLLGRRFGCAEDRGLPVVVRKGRALCGRFLACHGSLLCRDILGDARLPLRCMRVVQDAPELFDEAVAAASGGHALAPEASEACARLHAHLSGRGFHCAHTVLVALRDTIPVTQDLLHATCGFVGGTLFMGETCSALTAGVMAIGLATGEIEDSRWRVLRMIALMATGGRALDDGVNAFNRSMNRGNTLARWFAGRFGSTQCHVLTGCHPSSADGVARYVATGCVARCEELARAVADEARAAIGRTRGARTAA